MNIFDSYIDAGQAMAQREREQYYAALVEFLAYGKEPDVKGAAAAVMTAIRPSLEESRAHIVNGRKGGRPRKAPPEKPENRGCEKQETETPENEKAEPLKTEKPDAENTETETPETGKAKGKSKGKSKEEPPCGGSKKAAISRPTPAEVASFAASIGAEGFDSERFVDYYAAQGWRLSNGVAMRDWHAAVRNWLRRDAPARGEANRYGQYD